MWSLSDYNKNTYRRVEVTHSSLVMCQTLPRTSFWCLCLCRHVAFPYKISHYSLVENKPVPLGSVQLENNEFN
jgi:hypothetical protein